MNPNTTYYRENARRFFESTAFVDMSALHDVFLAKLPARAHILDAGCGSGRDAKAFADRGCTVSAFDASPELASLASQLCGFEVGVRTFGDVVEVGAFDGIWCCASLLHVPAAEVPACLLRLWRALRPGGCLYLSFKLGTGEREYAGRRFTDADDNTLRRWLSPLPLVSSVETWESEDKRPERSEQWLNALVTKEAVAPRKLVTGGDDPFLPHLSQAMARATEIDIAVAFVKTTGMRLLLPDLLAALQPTAEGISSNRRVP